MYKIAKPIILQAETPVHPGSGNDLGYIDNPIQREVHTGYPKIEGSTLKGALRQAFETEAPDLRKNKNDFIEYSEKINRIFGYDEDGLIKEVKDQLKDKTDFAGAIAFTDARILLFPVKSLKGTFAWVTCPRVLAKFKTELEDICKKEVDFNIPSEPQGAMITASSNLKLDNGKIQLDEYLYNANKTVDDKVINFLEKILKQKGVEIGDITKNLVIVSNNDFADFVKFGTEVNTRIKIDNETGTVKEGALFTVEYLPSEAVMYSLVMFSPEFRKGGMEDKEVKNFFDEHKPDYFQLGGDATLGKGIFSLNVPNLKDKKKEVEK